MTSALATTYAYLAHSSSDQCEEYIAHRIRNWMVQSRPYWIYQSLRVSFSFGWAYGMAKGVANRLDKELLRATSTGTIADLFELRKRLADEVLRKLILVEHRLQQRGVFTLPKRNLEWLESKIDEYDMNWRSWGEQQACRGQYGRLLDEALEPWRFRGHVAAR